MLGRLLSIAIGLSAMLGAGGAAAAATPAAPAPSVSQSPAFAGPWGLVAVSRTAVTFRGAGGVILNGTIVAPLSAGGHPGLVMIEGAGPVSAKREFDKESTAFAQREIVTLIYDKRTVGYSTFHRDYALLASDAVDAAEFLRARPSVDPSRVGLYGLSEGAWVGPLAATRTRDIAFLITAGAVGLSPVQQTAWSDSEFLRHAGVRGSLPTTIQNGLRLFAAEGWFPEANFDIVPTWRQVHQPVLLLWGADDRYAASAESSAIIETALRQANNRRFTVLILPGASHSLHATENDGFDHLSDLGPALAPTVAAWVSALEQAPAPTSVALAPPEDRRSKPVTGLHWYESGPLQIAVFVWLVFGFLASLVQLGLRRSADQRQEQVLRTATLWCGVLGLTSVLGSFLYFMFVGVTNANVIGPVVLGDPIPWMVVQATSAGTIVAAVLVAGLWLRRRSEPPRRSTQLGFLLANSVVFAVWAGYWGLISGLRRNVRRVQASSAYAYVQWPTTPCRAWRGSPRQLHREGRSTIRTRLRPSDIARFWLSFSRRPQQDY